MKRAFAAAVALSGALLATGCGRAPEPEATAPASEPAAAPAETASATPVASPTTTALPPSIPVALRGRWGLVPADCTSTRGDAKGLMTVGARELTFYESLGTLVATKERSDMRIAGTFAYEGEGMEWRREVTLDGKPGGKLLVLREQGDDAPPGPRQYTRCDT